MQPFCFKISHDFHIYFCNHTTRMSTFRVTEICCKHFSQKLKQYLIIYILDLSYLIAKLNRLDNTKELVSPETILKNKNINLYRYYFNTLNFDLLKKLVTFYETDSTLLNYVFDYTKRAIGGWD